MPNCELCGEPMPPGEEMFKYHGYSCECPKPPLSNELIVAKTMRRIYANREELEGKCWAIWNASGAETEKWNGDCCDCPFVGDGIHCLYAMLQERKRQ